MGYARTATRPSPAKATGQPSRRKGAARAPDVKDARIAASISILYGELSRALSEDDVEAADYAKKAIAELFNGVPSGEIDEPLMRAKVGK